MIAASERHIYLYENIGKKPGNPSDSPGTLQIKTLFSVLFHLLVPSKLFRLIDKGEGPLPPGLPRFGAQHIPQLEQRKSTRQNYRRDPKIRSHC